MDTVKEQFFSLQGRLNRKRYILRGLLVVIIGFIFGGLIATEVSVLMAIGGIGYVACLISTITIVVRRLHDVNKSGWWYLLFFVPVANFILSLYLLFKKGTDGPNNYGPNPLA